MATVPTYLYLGDEQITGGTTATAPPTGTPELWGVWRGYPTLNRVVPSGTDGITGGAYNPYWDGLSGDVVTATGATSTTITVASAGWTTDQWAGKVVEIDAGTGAGQTRTVASNTSDTITVTVAWTTTPTGAVFHVRTGKFLKFHYIADNQPTGGGDNWFQFGGGITPCNMLMQRLASLHSTATGFRMLKLGGSGGFGTAAAWKPGGTSWVSFIAQLDAMEAAMTLAGDEPEYRAVVIDCSTTDIANANLLYQVHAQEWIDGIRARVGDDCLLLLVNHPFTMLNTTLPAVAATCRTFNRALQQANPNVKLYDMSWGSYAPDSIFSSMVPATDPRYYDAETYIQAGAGIYEAIQAHYTAAPSVTPGTGMAGYFMIGDSQMLTAGMEPIVPLMQKQESILGPAPGYVRTGVYIWNDTTKQIEPYSVITNSSTFGSVANTFGPDATLTKALSEEHPEGVVLFKFAEGGVSLGTSALAFGAPGALEEGTSRHTAIKTAFQEFRIACLTQFGRSVDMLGGLVSLGENDLFSQTTVEEFEEKAPVFIDDLRGIFQTRAPGGPELPIVWLQGPPPAALVDGGSTLGSESIRTYYRNAVANLPSVRSRIRVLLNNGPGTYELNREDSVHYGGEAVYQIGYDAAAALLAFQSDEGGTSTETASGSAAFTVEDGSGSTTANSYCTVQFADTYHAAMGNPTAWSSLSEASKKDALRVATRAADERYGMRWAGERYTSAQALDWPRAWAVDAAGNDIGTDTIPTRLQQWTARAALLHVQGNELMPSTQTEAAIQSETLTAAGGFSVSKSYLGAREPATQFPALDRMLASANLITSGGTWGWNQA